MDPQDIRFENAYLYTAPNTEGELKVIEAKGLDQAMNQNQMLLVREALKDYRYEWASLQFDTSNGDFLLKLNMDGKPADLLPFRFDTQTASFVYDPESPGTHLQGLKLKTNFQCHGLWGIMMKGMKWMENVELK
jgi:hypothetical protein